MTFDQHGYLTPYDVIPTDLETLEQIFVNGFEESTTRRPIFEAYLKYLDQLRQIIGTGFYQWIDGSFTTQKLNPNDIDLITFVDWQIMRRYGSRLESLRNDRVDGNLGTLYLPEHKYHPLYLYEVEDWTYVFGTTKDNKYPKGILKINF